MQTVEEKPFKLPTDVALFDDIYDAVLDDKWMFIVVWGVQRSGKSSLAMWAIYYTWRRLDPSLTENQLWERVNRSIVFNLSQVIYAIKDPRRARVLTMNALHNRIPILVWDDFSGHSNKAITQHDRAWDLFKGGFDVLGTKISVVITTQVDPEAPTTQIGQKYTHECFIPKRGTFKYDRVEWLQDFYGWKPKKRKAWRQANSPFAEIPFHRFKTYDEMRQSLADEILINIEDAMIRKIPFIIKRLQPIDIELLRLTIKEGALSLDKIKGRYKGSIHDKTWKDGLKRLKARQLFIQESRNNRQWVDITNLGLEILNRLDGEEQ